MAAAVSVRAVRLAATGGIWCERCALPSGVVVVVGLLSDDQPSGVLVLRRCTDCGEPV